MIEFKGADASRTFGQAAILDLIGSLVEVTVIDTPGELNATEHTIGTIQSLFFATKGAKGNGGSPGHGSIMFKGRSAVHWNPHDTVRIAIIRHHR